MSQALEIGQQLVKLCSQGKNMEALETLYSPNIVSIEAAPGPDGTTEAKGIDAIKGKNQWWMENHEIHDASVRGPFPNGDQFSVVFNYDITNKPSGNRMQMEEVALFTVNDGKITKEQFFYHMG